MGSTRSVGFLKVDRVVPAMADGSWRPRRRFLVVGHTQTVTPDFALNDLAGGAGRLDVLVRMVTSAFCLSHGIRRDTEVWAVIEGEDAPELGPRTIRFQGRYLRSLNPDERSTAALFKRAFTVDSVEGGRFEEAHPGITVARMGFKDAVKRFAKEGPVLLLDRGGTDIRELDVADLEPQEDGTGTGFVLSDHEAFSPAEEKTLRGVARRVVSVGPLWLHGHGAITVVHDELDRRHGVDEVEPPE